jgi:hypothetical protein
VTEHHERFSIDRPGVTLVAGCASVDMDRTLRDTNDPAPAPSLRTELGLSRTRQQQAEPAERRAAGKPLGMDGDCNGAVLATVQALLARLDRQQTSQTDQLAKSRFSISSAFALAMNWNWVVLLSFMLDH